MVVVRRYMNMIDKLYYHYHKEGWFLEAVLVYCDAVVNLAAVLSQSELKSRGFLAFREFLLDYVNSAEFQQLVDDAKNVKNKLGSSQYSIIIKSNFVKVRKYAAEINYSVEVERTFVRFKQGEVKDYTIRQPVSAGMNHVEAQILNCVAKLFPDVFKELDQFCSNHLNFMDETIRTFDREIQFYIAYFELIEYIKRSGLRFCYPAISAEDKAVRANDTFDIVLANKLVFEHTATIPNDFYLDDPERIIVVSGPNQGGKTTFARIFGQLHYLASLGLPVPGRKAQLYLYDRIFTHFEKEEDIRNLRGKLQDDLVRIRRILDEATSSSIIIMNEIFTSTTLQDATFLSTNIIQKIMNLDALCICVSFIDELTTLDPKIVSMVSTVEPDNPALRTYKIVRKPADGLAYAISIAKKHRLTRQSIMERIKR
jgi:DNA mismatch repair ATPase MutS